MALQKLYDSSSQVSRYMMIYVIHDICVYVYNIYTEFMDYSISISFSAYNFHASNGLPRQGTKHREATMAHDDASRWGPGPWFLAQIIMRKNHTVVGWMVVGKNGLWIYGTNFSDFCLVYAENLGDTNHAPKKVIMSGVDKDDDAYKSRIHTEIIGHILWLP